MTMSILATLAWHSAAVGCVSWRQTAGCTPDGARESHGDRDCTMGIPNGWSGYCECADGRRAAPSTCTHRTFTCAQECAGLGHVGDEPKASAGAPSAPSASTCLGWRQTGGCEGHGPREARGDRDCSVVVQRDWSGFCSCGNGVQTAHTNCHHATFTCQEKCDDIAQNAPAVATLTPGATADCVGWHQTGGCSASGEREASGDATCATMVQGGWSGYCQCTGGVKTKQSNCHHQPFRCDTACEKAVHANKASKAAARESLLSASDKAKRAARRETERVAAAAGQAQLAANAAEEAEATAAKAMEEASALKVS